MKNRINLALAMFVAIFIPAISANAQAVTTGTINFSVTVNDAFDLRSNGPSSGTGTNGFTACVPGVANQALGVTLTVTDASPNTDNSTLTATVPIRMRSNRTYGVYATRVNTDSPSAVAFESSDIEMALSAVCRTGASVLGGTDTITTGWQVVGGTKKVGDLTASAFKILDGQRISEDGDNNSTDNFATSTVEFKIKRQYYTPTSGTPYTEQVTLLIAAP